MSTLFQLPGIFLYFVSVDDNITFSGIYPPQVKVYELRELSLKFERHLVSEIVNFQVQTSSPVYLFEGCTRPISLKITKLIFISITFLYE